MMKVVRWIWVFILDTIFAWIFALVLLIPILGTFSYRSVRRVVNAAVKLKTVVDNRNIKTVEQYMKEIRK
jgi:hypothetical protein